MNGDDNKTIDGKLELTGSDKEMIDLLEFMQTDSAKAACDALFSEDIDLSSTYEPGRTETKLS